MVENSEAFLDNLGIWPHWKDGIFPAYWDELRRHVFLRDGYRCASCGRRFGGKDLDCHHVTPWQNGGTDNPRNLQTLCGVCHDVVHETLDLIELGHRMGGSVNCQYCGEPIARPTRQSRKYCRDACKQAAYRRKRSESRQEPKAPEEPGLPEKAPQTPLGASESVSKPSYRNASPIIPRNDSVTLPWLWVDPRREPSYNPQAFDPAEFLARAVALFRSKPQWGGAAPNTVRAHPEQAANGLPAVAQALGLQVKVDPLVAPGTYRLGIATEKRGGRNV